MFNSSLSHMLLKFIQKYFLCLFEKGQSTWVCKKTLLRKKYIFTQTSTTDISSDVLTWRPWANSQRITPWALSLLCARESATFPLIAPCLICKFAAAALLREGEEKKRDLAHFFNYNGVINAQTLRAIYQNTWRCTQAKEKWNVRHSSIVFVFFFYFKIFADA